MAAAAATTGGARCVGVHAHITQYMCMSHHMFCQQCRPLQYTATPMLQMCVCVRECMELVPALSIVVVIPSVIELCTVGNGGSSTAAGIHGFQRNTTAAP